MAGLRAPDCRAGRRPRRRELIFVMAGLVPAVTTLNQPELLRRYSRVILSRNALPTTLTDDSAIAAAAMIGDSSNPKAG
jgi:hypothetical protein